MKESPALAAWLSRIEKLHPNTIELGLDRAGTVLGRLNLAPLPRVITVAGTNGKGSVTAMLDSMLRAAGHRTGLYTSPHFWHYCERVRIAGLMVDDDAMVQAFAAVEQARSEVPLTYFEFGTLAAFYLFAHAGIDVAVLEVGMGGRLDAVNLIDPDVAIITNVGLDHQDWLGRDRESIAREKAGIMRYRRPAVYAEADVPRAIRRQALAEDVALYVAERDYHWHTPSPVAAAEPTVGSAAGPASPDGHYWHYQGPLATTPDASICVPRSLPLPVPALPGPHQLANAAAALTALGLLAPRLPVPAAALAQGLCQVRLPGRLQQVAQAPAVYLDVAHNPAGTACLGAALQTLPEQRAAPGGGRTFIVFSALSDKDIAAMAVPLAALAAGWYVAPVDGPRARSAADLQQALTAAGITTPVHALQSIAEALAAARRAASAADRIVVCGSFLTVAAAAAALGLDRENSWIKH